MTRMSDFSDLWPLAGPPERLFVAGKTLREWQEELGEIFEIRYPWDLLDLNAKLLASFSESQNAVPAQGDGDLLAGEGEAQRTGQNPAHGGHGDLLAGEGEAQRLRASATPHVDGVLRVGEGTKVLPGVYVEGVVLIGKNCKIGPNCYLRGSTAIGDNCHVGQAVEVKNSIIGHGSAVGHLSYLGDSVLGEKVNFGAGTITSNLRHDGKNHRSQVKGELIETGRRKFGAIVGDGVHTGIHTSIYPGRKLGPGTSTRPGGIVEKDLFPQETPAV